MNNLFLWCKKRQIQCLSFSFEFRGPSFQLCILTNSVFNSIEFTMTEKNDLLIQSLEKVSKHKRISLVSESDLNSLEIEISTFVLRCGLNLKRNRQHKFNYSY